MICKKSKKRSAIRIQIPMKDILILAFLAVLMGGCTNIGPRTIPRDRFDYNAAITASWKEQTLLNIVRLRYADMPLFVNVASVISGYTLETSMGIGANQASNNALDNDTLTLSGITKYTDRPTITYIPITGSQFNKSFMTPIPPKAVLFLIQSGWPVDLIFPLTVESLNGLRSQISTGDSARRGNEDYYRAIELLRSIQKTGATGMQIQHEENSKDTAILIFHKDAMSDDGKRDFKEVLEILGLRSGLDSAVVKYGFLASNDAEIAMLTRSMLQLIVLLSTYVNVPPEHVAEGRTLDSQTPTEFSDENVHRLMRVSSDQDKPENAFVAVRYRDYWYWIDDRDFQSKRVFTFVMILFALTESDTDVGLPLVTIPTG